MKLKLLQLVCMHVCMSVLTHTHMKLGVSLVQMILKCAEAQRLVCASFWASSANTLR